MHPAWLFLFLSASVAGAATPPPTPPRAHVERVYKAIRQLSDTATDPSRLTDGIVTTVDTIVSWDAFAELTLTQGLWKTLSADQHRRFIAAYKLLIVERYARRFEPRTRFEVTFRGKTLEHRSDPPTATVRTTVTTGDGDKRVGADVDYHFVLTPGRDSGPPQWRVQDIETDTVSRAMLYRRTLTRIYKKQGFEKMLQAVHRAVDNARKKKVKKTP